MAHAAAIGEGALSPERLRAANIHPETGLATDYLNHFNEVVMLLEMLPDMPEAAADVFAWAPASYETHFERSGFAGRALALAAWRAADPSIREGLEGVVARLDAAIAQAQQLARDGDVGAASRLASSEIQPLIADASAVIHGRLPDAGSAAQSDVDALFDGA